MSNTLKLSRSFNVENDDHDYREYKRLVLYTFIFYLLNLTYS